jgi:translation initiation factor IF-2
LDVPEAAAAGAEARRPDAAALAHVALEHVAAVARAAERDAEARQPDAAALAHVAPEHVAAAARAAEPDAEARRPDAAALAHVAPEHVAAAARAAEPGAEARRPDGPAAAAERRAGVGSAPEQMARAEAARVALPQVAVDMPASAADALEPARADGFEEPWRAARPEVRSYAVASVPAWPAARERPAVALPEARPDAFVP